MVAYRGALQVADNLGARRRVTEFASCPLRRFVVRQLDLIRLAACNRYSLRARIERPDLADYRFNARIARGDIDDVTAGITRSTQTYSVLVDHRVTHSPMNGIEPIRNHFQGIDDFANLLYFCSELQAFFLRRRRARQNHSRIAFAPATVVKINYKIPGVCEIDCIATKRSRGPAPSVCLDDSGELLPCKRF